MLVRFASWVCRGKVVLGRFEGGVHKVGVFLFGGMGIGMGGGNAGLDGVGSRYCPFGDFEPDLSIIY